MNRHPDVADILLGVSDFLTRQIAPVIDDTGRRFRLRIAVHLLALAVRQIRDGNALALDELQRLLRLNGRLDTGSAYQPEDGVSLETQVDELNRALAASIRDNQTIVDSKVVEAHLKQTLINELSIAQPMFDTGLDIGDDT